MTNPPTADQRFQHARARARHVVYERLAFASAAIWAVGTAILFAVIVPVVPHPQPYIAVAMTVPLVPAALPWLFYGKISDALARRWTRERV